MCSDCRRASTRRARYLAALIESTRIVLVFSSTVPATITFWTVTEVLMNATMLRRPSAVVPVARSAAAHIWQILMAGQLPVIGSERRLVRPAGLEPATPDLEGRCSIQMSYGRTTSW